MIDSLVSCIAGCRLDLKYDINPCLNQEELMREMTFVCVGRLCMFCCCYCFSLVITFVPNHLLFSSSRRSAEIDPHRRPNPSTTSCTEPLHKDSSQALSYVLHTTQLSSHPPFSSNNTATYPSWPGSAAHSDDSRPPHQKQRHNPLPPQQIHPPPHKPTHHHHPKKSSSIPSTTTPRASQIQETP